MKHKIVRVTWVDSCSSSGWRPGSEVNAEAHTIDSIGYLVLQNKHSVVITTSISCNENVVDVLQIPKCAILKMKYLRG